MRLRIVDICDNPSSRAKGLQNRSIQPDECCVFVFDVPQRLSFWGKNTPQDLNLNAIADGCCMETLPICSEDLSQVTTDGEYSIAIETLDSVSLLGCKTLFCGDAIEVCQCSE